MQKPAKPEPAVPPDGEPDAGPVSDTGPTSNERNSGAVAGFILSLVALIVPSWLAYSFASNYDGWFTGTTEVLPYWLSFDRAASTALFVLFVVLPFECLLLAPALIFSIHGASRSKRYALPYGPLAVTGIVISAVALIMLAGVVTTALIG